MQQFKHSIASQNIWHLLIGESCLKPREDILHCLPSYICLFSDQLLGNQFCRISDKSLLVALYLSLARVTARSICASPEQKSDSTKKNLS